MVFNRALQLRIFNDNEFINRYNDAYQNPNFMGGKMSDWKNSPVIAVVVAGAAVLSTTLFVVFNYALPVYQKEDKNTIFDLKQELVSLQKRIAEKDSVYTLEKKKFSDEIKSLSNEVQKNKSLSDGYLKRLNELAFSSLFMKGDVLPIGYSIVRPGMTKNDLVKVYGAPQLIPGGEDGDVLSVKIGYGGLKEIEYLFQDRHNPKIISHIIVNKVTEYDYEMRDTPEYVASRNVSLKDFFIQSIGRIDACKKKNYAWHLDNKEYDLFIIDEDSYGLYLSGTRPMIYDQDCEPSYPNNQKKI
ncbi:hypothetical protein [Enterobacter bugandensis]|uniref:hypothetical protein n=1 Tax=Enterobacter bugandensis TaxID=881260 RepID=UPI0020062AEC|nr:hypothetical protein [Enterobacter bugandensis]MCK6878734.1 hypothetical protein [Enterobacter bugandensis]MDH0088312.1 hypothetical protein [Enterobacter bugandensis]MDH0110984.1 hypothetical protein [Enterobacter bugandensis]MDH0131453.1 hypothetical protein [Enterobacter bugandensis]